MNWGAADILINRFSTLIKKQTAIYPVINIVQNDPVKEYKYQIKNIEPFPLKIKRWINILLISGDKIL